VRNSIRIAIYRYPNTIAHKTENEMGEEQSHVHYEYLIAAAQKRVDLQMKGKK